MKVLVTGGRSYDNRTHVFDELDKIGEEWAADGGELLIIHGGAPGVDSYAGEWARTVFAQEVVCPANWLHGKKAGPVRNRAMLELGPDLVLAFPGGKGTNNMKALASWAGVKVRECFDPSAQ